MKEALNLNQTINTIYDLRTISKTVFINHTRQKESNQNPQTMLTNPEQGKKIKLLE